MLKLSHLGHLLGQLDGAARQAAAKPVDLIDRRFPKQAAFVEDPGQFIAALTTRRAGKTNGLGYRFYRAAQKYPGSICPYFALTRPSAEMIMWPVLLEQNKRYRIGATPTESDLTMTLPNGSKIVLIGADQKNFIERVRGGKFPFTAIDEAQSFRSHLEKLVDDILTPGISDYPDGAIALTGTPGAIPSGFFHEVTEKGLGGFSVHRWSVLDNPYMPRAKDFIENLLSRKRWTRENPTFRREWLGEWVEDLESLIYKYQEAMNRIESFDDQRRQWFYVLGVDMGFSPDPAAFVLCAYNMIDPHLYILEATKEQELDVTDVANRIKGYLKRYPHCTVVVDQGGGARQAVEEMRKRHGLSLRAAEKTEKMNFIEIMNSDLKQGVIKVVGPGCQPLIDEWQILDRDPDASKPAENPGKPNHCSDAALYAWRWAYNYAWAAEKPKHAPQSEEAVEEFWEKEAGMAGREPKPFWERD